MFEPGAISARSGPLLANWATASGMDYTGTLGTATHRYGHVLDLTFSNNPFTHTIARADMHCGSDHETQVTTIPSQGQVPLDQFYYRVPETELAKFAGLVENRVARLP